MPPFDQQAVKVTRAAHGKLTAIQKQMADERDRQVTFAEVIDELIRRYEMLILDAEEAGR